MPVTSRTDFLAELTNERAILIAQQVNINALPSGARNKAQKVARIAAEIAALDAEIERISVAANSDAIYIRRASDKKLVQAYEADFKSDITSDVNMNGYHIGNLADPVSAQQAATKAYVDAEVSANILPVGTIVPFAGLSAPAGWHLCDGTILPVSASPALCALVANSFGGDGVTTFGVPDLQGLVIVGMGTSTRPGISPRGYTQVGGEETHTLDVTEIPAHHHSRGFLNTGTSGGGAGSSFGDGNNTGDTGGGAAHNNMQPFMALGYIIKL